MGRHCGIGEIRSKWFLSGRPACGAVNNATLALGVGLTPTIKRGEASRGWLSESEESDFRCAYGGTAKDCDLSFLTVERYRRPKQLGRLLMQGDLVPKLQPIDRREAQR